MIGKYSIVKFKDENGNFKSGYVQNKINNLLQISNYNKMVEIDNAEELAFGDMPSSDLVETAQQIKLLNEIFKIEIKRRAYDIEKNKTKSKYFHDELIFRKPDDK